MIDKLTLTIASGIFLLTMANPAHGQLNGQENIMSMSGFERFAPNPASAQHIDYQTWGDLLEFMVLSTGQSTRVSAPKPTPTTGSRLVLAHKSPFRMEGNKIAFSKFKPEFTELISGYRQELEDIGNSINIAQLSRNEQLAYWMNLHNVTIIEQIALAYPETTPISLKIGPHQERLHEAKIINIRGQALSLRDIRENIIYKNWADPVVIYGFFLGDLGSPSIQNYAFSSENIQTALDVIAYEFTNSLRGFSRGRASKIYSDTQAYFFPNFQKDLKIHLRKYMRDDVAEELSRYENLKVAGYPYRIADVVGGYGNRTQGLPVARRSQNGDLGADLRNDAFSAYMTELREKYIMLNKMGLTKRGTVIIEDIETIVSENEPDLGN